MEPRKLVQACTPQRQHEIPALPRTRRRLAVALAILAIAAASPAASGFPAFVYFSDDFDASPTPDPAKWAVVKGAAPGSDCGVHSAPRALTFTGKSVREAITVPIVARGLPVVTFLVRFGTPAMGPVCDPPGPGDQLELSHRLGGGGPWIPLVTVTPVTDGAWHRIEETVPASPLGSTIELRWRQTSTSPGGYDNWAIDDVVVSWDAGASCPGEGIRSGSGTQRELPFDPACEPPPGCRALLGDAGDGRFRQLCYTIERLVPGGEKPTV